jgi:hypothetical protein
MYVVDHGFNSPNRKCSIRDFGLARLRVCPGKPGAGNPHAGFYLGGEAQGQPRLLPTDHSIDRTQLRDVLRQRVNDGRIVRLIGKWLRAGVWEEGVLNHPDTGVVQGGTISPVLANIFLHQVLDAWFEQEVQPHLKGRSFLIRFADDCAPRRREGVCLT